MEAQRGLYSFVLGIVRDGKYSVADKKRITHGPTDGRTDRSTDGWTDLLIEMRGRI